MILTVFYAVLNQAYLYQILAISKRLTLITEVNTIVSSFIILYLYTK